MMAHLRCVIPEEWLTKNTTISAVCCRHACKVSSLLLLTILSYLLACRSTS